ncbi:MAG: endonuclease/exonuclease/phosphatase family protein [Prevotellaceae bacterium]|jgi:endonuclease/exonuclease/phosphatase family metal-dependent hydrolase|nr:endonuclease/exonuclease/phosphatase family protein [Prevotellaceae bacterium]
MKRIKFILFFLFIFSVKMYGAEDETLNICNANILYDKTNGKPEETWAYRKDITLNFYNTHKFDIIAMQEVSQTQLADFKQWKDYDYVGQGVYGDSSGMANLIFFKLSKIELVESGTFWFSPTPSQVSKGWDAAQFRNCTWACLKDKRTNRIFYYFVAHFDHIGKDARLHSALLMIDTIPKIAKGYPVIFSGDLNAVETDALIVALKERLIDPRTVTRTPPQGSYGTGHGFRINVAVRRIDWFFLNNGNGSNRFEVEEYEVIDKTYDGKCMSDHWPVRIKIKLTKVE